MFMSAESWSNTNLGVTNAINLVCVCVCMCVCVRARAWIS